MEGMMSKSMQSRPSWMSKKGDNTIKVDEVGMEGSMPKSM
jgi:hypothetical protein